MKKVLMYVAIGILAIPFTYAAVKAADKQWEYKTRQKLEYMVNNNYEGITPELLSEIKKCMPDSFKFEEWGHPEFDCDGHCDFDAMVATGISEKDELDRIMKGSY
jgi:hypothetical protein